MELVCVKSMKNIEIYETFYTKFLCTLRKSWNIVYKIVSKLKKSTFETDVFVWRRKKKSYLKKELN